MTKLLLKNANVLGTEGLIQADIAIDGSYIISIGQAPDNWQANDVIDCTGKLAIPGFINTHTHAAMTLFRSYADDMLLMDWLQNKIWPAEANLTSEDVYWGSLLAIAEMLKSGTTTFADMYFYMPQVAQAVAESGIRAVLARGMAGVAPNGEQAIYESELFYKEWHNAADGRITVMLGPHAPYTCPPKYLTRVVSLAQRLGAEIHIHLAETTGEVENCLKEHGKTPIALMNELGVLDCGVLAAHCVHLTPQDIKIMQQKKVRVAHNPGSNMKLASGIAPIMDLLSAGVCVGLGTDGAASNNNLDMLEEARLASLLAKVSSYNPLAIPAPLALTMATTNGAIALGLNTVTGSLKPGLKADITLFSTKHTHWCPHHDSVSLLVYSAQASDVDTVIVDGKTLLAKGSLTTIDEEQLIYEVQRRSFRLTNK